MRSMKHKKILLLVHAPQTRPGHLNWFALRDLVREQLPDVTVEMSALSDLTLSLNGKDARIYDDTQGFDVADFDLVVFRTTYGQTEIAISVAAYCRKKGVTYIDQYMPNIGNTKLSCAFVRWEHDLPVPPTVYGPASSMERVARQGTFGWPLVVKADRGKKGKDNYLVRTVAELGPILAEHADKHFVMQTFIPNAGDYRILVFNGKVRAAILRTAGEGSHLNNTSQGGAAELLDIATVDPAILELSIKAAELERLAIAGVDIITKEETGEPFILEVNRAPQLATGANVAIKMQEYGRALQELLEDN